MSSIPTLTVIKQCQISPHAIVGDRSLPLTFFDFFWLSHPPLNSLFFFELPITKTQFTQTIIPNLKSSLSITLNHYFPFAGNLIVYPSNSDKKPKIQYVEGDSVKVTFAESNLDFNDLTGNHPRDCDKFYHLIPPLRRTVEVSDFITIPVFSVQVTLFADCGFSIGLTTHHTLADAATLFFFLKAWTSIAQTGNDELFLANGTLPVLDRLVKNPNLDESYLKKANVETWKEDYQPLSLSTQTDNVRTTIILTKDVVSRLKNLVSTQIPTLSYISSYTVASGYIWSCIAESRNDELHVFGTNIDCRSRMNPALPDAYFGNCVTFCSAIEKPHLLTSMDGFLNASKLIGESLYNALNDKDGVVKDYASADVMFPDRKPTTSIGVSGTNKLLFYDMDFGWGKPIKYETISIDYDGSISLNACKEANKDLEIGVCLSPTEMEAFLPIFNHGLEAYI